MSIACDRFSMEVVGPPTRPLPSTNTEVSSTKVVSLVVIAVVWVWCFIWERGMSLVAIYNLNLIFNLGTCWLSIRVVVVENEVEVLEKDVLVEEVEVVRDTVVEVLVLEVLVEILVLVLTLVLVLVLEVEVDFEVEVLVDEVEVD